MTIYVVTSGNYSDYAINGLFSSSELAQQYIAKRDIEGHSESFEVEEWELDAMKDAEWFHVWDCGIFLDDGSFVEDQQKEPFEVFAIKFRGQVLQEAVSVPAYLGRKIVRVRSSVSMAHARKVAVEARQKWLAQKDDRNQQTLGS